MSSDPRNCGTAASGYFTNLYFFDEPVALTGGTHVDFEVELDHADFRVSMKVR